jgi:glycosyltransferase involved in cell wall biosynthesis
MRLAYLYSRYPVISQTFCDTEMLALERLGVSIEIGSIHPPLTSLRHEHAARLKAPIYYAPPQHILRIREKQAKAGGPWPTELVDQHEQKYGKPFKAAQRARNALYFADLFVRHNIEHCHVHFANRAAHTALFLKKMTGITFSVSAHGQDFMVDLGNDELLREIFREAEFVGAETDYSMKLLQQRCPESADKIHRVYNGMDLDSISASQLERPSGPTTILSVGRLVPFKGFEILIEACAELDQSNVAFHCEIVGDGPLREKLEAAIRHHRLEKRVQLCGSLSQERVFSKLQNCDIFALASVTDQNGASDVFPTVILEAMALARPVVSTRLAGIPESVIDGVTGLLVPPGDSHALADALDKLVRDSIELWRGRAKPNRKPFPN